MRHIELGCPCRSHVHPEPFDIPPGLDHLVRRVAGYGQFRRAMLSDASRPGPLRAWTAREEGDLGVLLLEMWAVACSIVSFADETICHECYIRTARRDESLRDLVRRLGYRPRPAVAATVELSLRAKGRDTITIPAGTAFRSGAVDDEPPQIFESLGDHDVHPLVSRLRVPRRRVRRLGGSTGGAGGGGAGSVEFAEVTALLEGVGVGKGALVLVEYGATPTLRRLADVKRVRGPGPKRAVVVFDRPLSLPASTEWDDVDLSVSDRTNRLFTLAVTGYSQVAVSTSGGVTKVTLDGLYRQFSAGERVVLERGGMPRWFTVSTVEEPAYHVGPDVTFTTDDGEQTVPGPTTPVTRLVLDAQINNAARRVDPADTTNWTDAMAAEIEVRAGWRSAASLEAPLESTLEAGSSDPISVGSDLDTPWQDHAPERFTVVDRDGRSVTATGRLQWDTGEVELDQKEWDPPLRHPITIEGNVVAATRGETVVGEVLGSGDAAIPSQAFPLANAPLTHLGPSAAGGTEVAVSTLTVWVDGIRWDEVPHFVGTGPRDRVYVTRETDDGGTEVVFGDGVRGARLPTGTDNVVASYRWGAGAVHPPARSISQLVEPVEGIGQVVNHRAAYGGADREPPSELRTNAPRSAVLLGRIVSREDAVAATRIVPGVRVASADWDWHAAKLQAGILVRYVGAAGLAEGIRRRLRTLAERDVHIDVVVSPPQPVAVTVNVVPDPRRHRADVEAAVIDALVGEGGVLTPEVLGIDGALFRSRLMAAAVAAEGVLAVTGALVDGAMFDDIAVAPAPGKHLDGTGHLTVVLEDSDDA